MRRAALVIMVVAGCAKSIEDQPKVACPANLACEPGFSCSAGVCVKAVLDAPCQLEGATGDDCALNSGDGPTLACIKFDAHHGTGRCMQSCTSASTCPADHTCVAGECFPNAMDGMCPVLVPDMPDVVTTWPDGSGGTVQVCAPPTPELGESCASVVSCALHDPSIDATCLAFTCVVSCATAKCPAAMPGSAAIQCLNATDPDGDEALGCWTACSSDTSCRAEFGASSSCAANDECAATDSRADGVPCSTDDQCANGQCLPPDQTVGSRVCTTMCQMGRCDVGFTCNESAYCVPSTDATGCSATDPLAPAWLVLGIAALAWSRERGVRRVSRRSRAAS